MIISRTKCTITVGPRYSPFDDEILVPNFRILEISPGAIFSEACGLGGQVQRYF